MTFNKRGSNIFLPEKCDKELYQIHKVTVLRKCNLKGKERKLELKLGKKHNFICILILSV